MCGVPDDEASKTFLGYVLRHLAAREGTASLQTQDTVLTTHRYSNNGKYSKIHFFSRNWKHKVRVLHIGKQSLDFSNLNTVVL